MGKVFSGRRLALYGVMLSWIILGCSQVDQSKNGSEPVSKQEKKAPNDGGQAKEDIKPPEMVACSACTGSGHVKDRCHVCDEGRIDCPHCTFGKVRCRSCDGRGQFRSGNRINNCSTCLGSGETLCLRCDGKLKTCHHCAGKGEVDIICGWCRGEGKVAKKSP